MPKKTKSVQEELMDLVKEMLYHMSDYVKCTAHKCATEKAVYTANPVTSKINTAAILQLENKSKATQNKTIKKWINNPILLDYERCNYNKCNEISKKLMKKVIEVSRKTKLLKNNVINPDEESFYKEFDDLLEKQNISDKELKKILELNMKITLL
jgi:predicted hydrolase (HD superfamily)